jgi:hypothetical protein
MFKKTRQKIRNTFERIKAAFELFISTLNRLTIAFEVNTETHQKFNSKLDQLIEHSRFLASAKKQELERAGHRPPGV